LPELACVVPVDENGRAVDDENEPIPTDQRTRTCGEDGRWMVGAVAVCDEHFKTFCDVGGIDYDGVVDECRSLY
jgi:hypothetical protein